VEDWAEIRRLHLAEGVPIKEIARRLGVARNTVRAALASDKPPKYERAPKGSVADEYEQQVRALLREWPTMPAPVVARRIGWPCRRSANSLAGRSRNSAPGPGVDGAVAAFLSSMPGVTGGAPVTCHRTRRAWAGQAGACPHFLPEGLQRLRGQGRSRRGRRRRRCAAALGPEWRPRALARRVPRPLTRSAPGDERRRSRLLVVMADAARRERARAGRGGGGAGSSCRPAAGGDWC
jgi:hypothetical protein